MFDQLPQAFHYIFEFASSLWSVNSPLGLINVLQILVLAFFVFRIYKYIAGTHAEQLLKGILVLIFTLLLSKLFKLQIISALLESVVNIVIFSLVVIFQPELRRFLVYLGQKGFLNKNIINPEGESEVQEIVEGIVTAVKHLSKSHTGALIVFQNSKGVEITSEVGIKLHALISTELLLTIFHPNTPLHDGAVVINGNRIIASGVLLPLTEDPKLSWQYGTRHRAAIGMSEVSDSTCLVVSEETGSISLAQGGKLSTISELADLRSELEFLYGISESVKEKTEEEVKEKSKFRFNNFFSTEFLLKKDENK